MYDFGRTVKGVSLKRRIIARTIFWIIVGCLNLNSAYLIVPVLNFICAAVLLVSVIIQVKRYLSFKAQG